MSSRSKFFFILPCCALLLRAEFIPSNWQYRRPLLVDSSAQEAVFTVDRTIYLHSQPELGDLRIVEEHGQEHAEVPYVLETRAGSHKRTESLGDVVNTEVTASGDLELTVDSGGHSRHNGLRITTAKTNFRQKASVSTSDDGRHWTLVRDSAYIFDFHNDGRAVSILDLSYPTSLRRYVRLTVRGWQDPRAITACWLALEEDEAPARDEIASLAVSPTQDEKTQSTVFDWDLGTAGIPYDALTVVVDTPEFQRAAALETSVDQKVWSNLGQGVLSRFRNEQFLKLTFTQNSDRYLRLRIFNRDDRPLTVQAATLSATRRRVKFRHRGKDPYWIYYGNTDAHRPAYDLAEVMEHSPGSNVATLSLGQEERNPAYLPKAQPLKPWSERHPGFLYLTLALAIVTMGAITVCFFKKVSADGQ